jgi:peptidoglycan/xylan/chitin deacetylase (PgdA/CDA1 family)
MAMFSRMAIKRTLKRAAGQASVALSPLVATSEPAACILAYHRVADIHVVDPDRDNWNVPPSRFDAQMTALAGSVDFVRLERLPALLAESPRRDGRPRVCVTFDDGFASVHAHALPVLRRLGIPATAFVVTAFVGGREPMPFDRWSRHNAGRAPLESWRCMNWQELEECAASGVLEIGAHSHQHLDGRRCTATQLEDEAGTSRAILRARLGSALADSYAYPYGSTRLGEVPPIYVDAVKAAGYQRAVSSDLGLATGRSDPFLLPRVEVAGVDSPSVLLAKARGSLWPVRLTDRLRQADRLH